MTDLSNADAIVAQEEKEAFEPFILNQQDEQEGQPTPAAAPAPAQEAPVASAEITEEGEGGILSTIGDMIRGALRGAQVATQETMQAVGAEEAFADTNATLDRIKRDQGLEVDDAPFTPIDKPTTIAGGVTESISQFVVGFIGAGKFLKGAKLLQGGTKAGVATRGIVQGSIADGIVFDPHEERLSDFLNDAFPSIRNPVFDFLSADPEDSNAEGRLKNALEGAILGLGAEGIFLAIAKGVKRIRTARADRAAKKITQEEADNIVAEEFTEIEKITDAAPAVDAAPVKRDILTTPTLPIRAGSKDLPGGSPAKVVDTAVLKKALLASDDLELQDGVNPYNWDKHSGTEGSLRLIAAAAEVSTPILKDRLNSGRVTFKQIEKQAQEMGEAIGASTEDILAVARKRGASAEGQAAFIVEGKRAVQGLANELDRIMTVIKEGNATPQQEALFLQRAEQMADLSESVQTVRRESARATVAGRIQIEGLSADELSDLVLSFGGSKRLQRAANRIKAAGSKPRDVRKFIELSRTRKTINVVNEFFVNSILSGIKTQAINAFGNTFQAHLLPLEKIIGGALRGTVTGDFAVMREGTRQMAGLYMFLNESLGFAAKTFRTGDNTLDAAARTIDIPIQKAISSSGTGHLAAGINHLGNVVRLPSRFLMSSDELFKQANYRGFLYAKFYGEALENGLKDKDSIARFVRESMDQSVDKTGKALDQQALEFAREATFTTKMEKGEFGHLVQSGVNAHPLARQIIPFVRTPTNILRATWERTPGLQFARTKFRDNMFGRNGAEEQARAMGKMATGGMITASAIFAANNGMITGGGPYDPEQNKAWRAAGNLPYSYVSVDEKTGKKIFTQFLRADPFAMFFGMAADMAMIANSSDEAEYGDLALMGMIALQRNLTSKSYLMGVTEALQAFNDPERSLARWRDRHFAAFVPTLGQQAATFADSIVAGVGVVTGASTDFRFGDELMREQRSMLDSVMARIPGLSKTLPPKRSWITGEPLVFPGAFFLPEGASPFAQKEGGNDAALDEIAKLGHGFGSPLRSIDNTELSTEQYSNLLRLHGKVRLGGKNMLDRIRAEIGKSSYDVNRTRRADTIDPDQNFRVDRIRRIIARYRKAAVRQLKRDDKDLDKELRRQRRLEFQARKGRRPSAIDALNEQTTGSSALGQLRQLLTPGN